MGRKKAFDPKMDRAIAECVMFRLKPEERIEYIQMETGKVLKPRTINKKIELYNSEERTNTWMNEFTRIGFIKFQQEHMERLQTMLEQSYRDLYEEQKKPDKNIYIIRMLRADIRATTTLLHEFALGTPSLAAVREKLKKKRLLDPATT
jgi:hypothetical protein